MHKSCYHPSLLPPEARQSVDTDDLLRDVFLRAIFVNGPLAVIERPVVIDDAET